jgi:hypothetical protein
MVGAAVKECRLWGTETVKLKHRTTETTLRVSRTGGEGRRCRRFRTASCCLSARFSSARSERSRRVVGIRESSRRIVRIMVGKSQAPRHRKSTVSMRPEFWQRTGNPVIQKWSQLADIVAMQFAGSVQNPSGVRELVELAGSGPPSRYIKNSTRVLCGNA